MANKLYRIIDATLECKGDSLKISYAICFEENGIFSFDTRVTDMEFYKKYRNSYIALHGLTDDHHRIEAKGLFISSFKMPSGSIILTCDRFIRIIKSWNGELIKEYIPFTVNHSRVYGIELEGLKMHFSDRTDIERYRKYGKIEDLIDFKFDHNQCGLLIKDESLEKYYSVLFSAHSQNDNILVEFVSQSGHHDLFYEDYKRIRSTFIQFLSFINGAHILLRKEFTGNFHSLPGMGNVETEITSTYSRKPLDKQYYSDYLPINQDHTMTDRILPILMLKGFNNYYKFNKTLDLNALVASLNDAYQTSGSRERYYILITALERIVNNFIKPNQKSNNLLETDFFNNTLKAELLKTIENYRSEIKSQNNAAYDIFKSRIGGLNKLRENDNKQKFYQFFDFCKIDGSPYIINLIEVERNQAVHEGKVGNDDNEAYTLYLKLDHLLRDIVLNLIDYDRIRKPLVHYQTPYPYSTPWSE